jgi:hypothetical protein
MGAFPDIFRKSSRPEETSLTSIRIASPCPADWAKMAGDERVRHCSECNLNVYNLSAMTERQVKQLIAGSQGQRVCARFYRRADGTVLTQDCPWRFRTLARKVSRFAAAVLAAVMSAGLAFARSKPQPVTCECRLSQQKDPGIKLTIMDQHGAVIPNAEITLAKKSGKDSIAGLTGPAGEWSAPKLPPGQYDLTIKARGFRSYTSIIDVREGMLLGLKLKLPVADVNVTVAVQAEPLVVMGTVGILTVIQDPVILPSGVSGGQHSPMHP